jgi:hypothetical protein
MRNFVRKTMNEAHSNYVRQILNHDEKGSTLTLAQD